MFVNSKTLFVATKTTLASMSLLLLAGCPNPFQQAKQEQKESCCAHDSNALALATETPKSSGNGPKIVEFTDGSGMTMQDIDSEIAKTLAANPYTKNMDPAQITPDMKGIFFEDVLNRRLIDLWAKDNAVEKNNDFQRDLQQTIQLVVQAKRAEYFASQVRNNIGNTISDSEVKKNFNQNKSRYVKTPGGVATAAVRFGSSDEAKGFLEKIDASTMQTTKDFEDFASSESLTAKNFGRISAQAPRGAHKAIVDEATSRRTFPTVEMVKVGNDEFWVAMFENNQETVYYEFDEVKEQLRAMAENEMFANKIKTELKQLHDKYVKSVDNSAFKVSGQDALGQQFPTEEDLMMDKEASE